MNDTNVKTDEHVVIFRPYITVKGKRIYAHQKGLAAFALKIPAAKYKD